MAKSLMVMAAVTLERLESTIIEEYPSNSLHDYYGILHKLMEAIASVEGCRFSGEGSHSELIDHICRTYHVKEQERLFLQRLHDYRNRIEYGGFAVRQEYLVSRRSKLNGLVALLRKILARVLAHQSWF
jgi:hypothetical protein